MTTYGYLRVSTDEQGESGLGMEAQLHMIEADARRRGAEMICVYVDAGLSGKNMKRPGMQALLDAVKTGDTLIAAKLARLSRSAIDAQGLCERAKREGWTLVALDVGADTSTPNGRMMWGMLAVLAQWEQETIAERTREALAAAKRRGTRLGPKRRVPDQVVARIVEDRARGMTFAAIARELTADKIPTPHGGAWSSARCHALVRSHQLDEEAKANVASTRS